jgi:hypothetical protein
VPLLEFVDHPACIRPTRRMASEARTRGWPVWEWPRARAAWKVKAEAAFLLLFAWSPAFLAAPKESPTPDENEIERQAKGIQEEMAHRT